MGQKNLMRIVTAIFALVGAGATALVLFGILFARGCTPADEHSVSNTLESPSGIYTAIVYTRMGGGAAGWCDSYLTVLRSSTTFDPQNDEQSPLMPHFGCNQPLELTWLNEKTLRVGIKPDASGAVEADFIQGLPISEVELEYVLIGTGS